MMTHNKRAILFLAIYLTTTSVYSGVVIDKVITPDQAAVLTKSLAPWMQSLATEIARVFQEAEEKEAQPPSIADITAVSDIGKRRQLADKLIAAINTDVDSDKMTEKSVLESDNTTNNDQ